MAVLCRLRHFIQFLVKLFVSKLTPPCHLHPVWDGNGKNDFFADLYVSFNPSKKKMFEIDSTPSPPCGGLANMTFCIVMDILCNY